MAAQGQRSRGPTVEEELRYVRDDPRAILREPVEELDELGETGYAGEAAFAARSGTASETSPGGPEEHHAHAAGVTRHA